MSRNASALLQKELCRAKPLSNVTFLQGLLSDETNFWFLILEYERESSTRLKLYFFIDTSNMHKSDRQLFNERYCFTSHYLQQNNT